MKVRQLIKLLMEQSPENDVIFWDKYEGENHDINQVTEDGVNGEETIINS